MDIMDSGLVQMSSYDLGNLTKAEEFVKNLIAGSGPSKGGVGGGGRGRPADYAGPEPVVGENYDAKITGIHMFGVFLEILPGPADGSTRGFEALCHVSELALDHVRNCEGYIKSLGVETLKVKYMGKERGKAKVSRKAVLEEGKGKALQLTDRTYTKTNGTNLPSPAKMPDAELDVIAKAIEEI